jgi:hypothetical protein
VKQAQITLEEGPSDGGVHRFTVDVGGRAFKVSVTDALANELAPNVAVEQLVTESFVFLLEREPVESILRSFDLSVIESYFPEYRRTISRRLR